MVQAAVLLIEQAVAKYKELCECKRRGEFVQREHVINGVEFYYQPPPRKAFANSGSEPSRQAEEGSPRAQLKGPVVAASAPIASHHAWLQHLQQQQVQAVAAQQQKQQAHISLLDAAQVVRFLINHYETKSFVHKNLRPHESPRQNYHTVCAIASQSKSVPQIKGSFLMHAGASCEGRRYSRLPKSRS